MTAPHIIDPAGLWAVTLFGSGDDHVTYAVGVSHVKNGPPSAKMSGVHITGH